MSRIGKKPVAIPAGVTVELNQNLLKVAGKNATLTMPVHTDIKVEVNKETNQVLVERHNDERLARAMHGTTRALIANMMEGVTAGFAKSLQVYGTGYGVKVQGNELQVTAGTAKPFCFTIPQGINVDVKTPNARGNDNPAEFTVSGADKTVVGQFAAQVRKCRPPEPYKGKGIRYTNEVVKRKVGKAFGSA